MHRKPRKKLCVANIEIRSNFVLSKNRSWVIVDVCNIFWGGSLIRACTGSFGNVSRAANLGNIEVGQIFVLSKKRS